MASASCASRPSGFSHRTCLPARAASIVGAACRALGPRLAKTPTSSAMSSCQSVVTRPTANRSAKASSRARSRPAIATSRGRSASPSKVATRPIASACARPMNPWPSIPTPMSMGRPYDKEHHGFEDQPRHLGAGPDGHPIRAQRLSARARARADAREGPPRRRGPRRSGRRVRVPLPRRAQRGAARRRARGARRPRHLHDLLRPARRPALWQGRPHVARREGPRGGAEAHPGRRRVRLLAGRPLHHLARDRGLQLPVPVAVRRCMGAADRRHRASRRHHGQARRQGPARAQELRAGDEDPHGQHRDDAARHPQAARPGDRQRPGQHGLAAPDHERREPGRVRRAARRRGPARPSARELWLGHVRRRQHDRRHRVHGDARGGARAAPRELRRQRRAARHGSLSVHRGPGRGGAPQRAAVALHRRGREPDRRARAARLPGAQGRRCRLRARLRGAGGVTESAFIGIDVGTTAVKALAVSPSGEVLARAQASYPLSTPRPGWAEQDPEDWWRATQAALADLGVAPAAIGLSGQMHGLVALDAADEVIRPAILWNDGRTQRQCDAIEETVGLDRLIGLTGNRALAGFTAPKLLWMRDEEPDVYDRIRSVLLPKDYVRLRLCGEHAIDVADASGTLLFDVAGRRWSDEVLDALEIDRSWLPRVVESPEMAGETHGGVPVAAGAGDQAAGALGVGVVSEGGPASVVLGTSGVVFAALDRYAADPQARVHAFCHAVPGAWHVMGVMLSAAGSLRWLRDTLGGDIQYDELLAGAADWEPGCEGLYFAPYLAGERTPYPDPDARVASLGLGLLHDRGALTRAVLEGVAFGLRDALDLVVEMGGAPASGRVSGGGGRGSLWLEIVASVLGIPLELTRADEGAAYGAALLGGVAAGVWSDAREAVTRCVQVTRTIEPRPEWVERYAELQPAFRRVYPALRAARGD